MKGSGGIGGNGGNGGNGGRLKIGVDLGEGGLITGVTGGNTGFGVDDLGQNDMG